MRKSGVYKSVPQGAGVSSRVIAGLSVRANAGVIGTKTIMAALHAKTIVSRTPAAKTTEETKWRTQVSTTGASKIPDPTGMPSAQ